MKKITCLSLSFSFVELASPTPPRSPPAPRMEFRLEPALERRDPGSVITAIALDDDGGRIYVGEEK